MDEKEVKCFTIIYKKSKDKFGEEFCLSLISMHSVLRQVNKNVLLLFNFVA